MFAGVIPFQSSNTSPKLLIASKLFAGFQKDEAVAVLAPLALPHRMIPIVIQEVFVDRDDGALPLYRCIYCSWVFLPRYSEVLRRVHVILRPEHVPKVAVAFV